MVGDPASGWPQGTRLRADPGGRSTKLRVGKHHGGGDGGCGSPKLSGEEEQGHNPWGDPGLLREPPARHPPRREPVGGTSSVPGGWLAVRSRGGPEASATPHRKLGTLGRLLRGGGSVHAPGCPSSGKRQGARGQGGPCLGGTFPSLNPRGVLRRAAASPGTWGEAECRPPPRTPSGRDPRVAPWSAGDDPPGTSARAQRRAPWGLVPSSPSQSPWPPSASAAPTSPRQPRRQVRKAGVCHQLHGLLRVPTTCVEPGAAPRTVSELGPGEQSATGESLGDNRRLLLTALRPKVQNRGGRLARCRRDPPLVADCRRAPPDGGDRLSRVPEGGALGRGLATTAEGGVST